MSQTSNKEFKKIIDESVNWFVETNFSNYTVENKEKISKVCKGDNKQTMLEYYENQYNVENLNLEEKEKNTNDIIQKNRDIIKKIVSTNGSQIEEDTTNKTIQETPVTDKKVFTNLSKLYG